MTWMTIWTFPIFLAVAVSLVLLVGFFLLLRRRWFSRWRRGFLITLCLALGGAAILSACLIALWGYQTSRRLLEGQIVRQMDNTARVLEASVQQDLAQAFREIVDLPAALGGLNWNDPRLVEAALEEILQIDSWFLQLRLFDVDGIPIAAVGRQGELEEPDFTAVTHLLKNESYVSNPFRSKVFEKFVVILGVPVPAKEGGLKGVVVCRYDIQSNLAPLVRSAHFGESGYGVVVGPSGEVLAHPDPQRIDDDISSYPAVQAGLRGESGSVVARNKAGVERLFFYRPLASPATVNPKPMVILTEMDTDEAARPLHELREEFAAALVVLALAAGIVAFQLSKSIKQPLREVVDLAHRVEKGDFSAESKLAGQDEFGRLAGAFNGMVRGLQERDRVKEIFGRYVTTQVSEEVLKGNLSLGGQSRRVTILFSDIRGFTAMSETMTPEQVVDFLNAYFTEMVDAVFDEGGVLDKFLGDGMLAVFGSLGEVSDHPRRAVRAALRMQAALGRINDQRAAAGKGPIAIGIGIHTAEVVVGNIGSKKRLEYTVIGDGVNTCSRVQALNKQFGTSLLITEDTYREVGEEFECRLMPEAQIRGKSQAVRFYEVAGRRG